MSYLHQLIWLVVWNIFYFPFHIWDVILPIDELIFFKMVKTTNLSILGVPPCRVPHLVPHFLKPPEGAWQR
jgi:hypothetical protein